MTKDEAIAMIKAIANQLDYDIYKQLNEETAEEPEYVEETLDELVDVVRNHLDIIDE